jgi:hypothetical protein
MLPPWRRKLAATGAHSGPSKRLANVAISPSTIVTIAPRLCDSTTTRANTANASVSTTGRAIGNPLAAQRRSDKDQAELGDQQNRQARISDPVLPGTKRLSPAIKNGRTTLILTDQRLCRHCVHIPTRLTSTCVSLKHAPSARSAFRSDETKAEIVCPVRLVASHAPF